MINFKFFLLYFRFCICKEIVKSIKNIEYDMWKYYHFESVTVRNTHFFRKPMFRKNKNENNCDVFTLFREKLWSLCFESQHKYELTLSRKKGYFSFKFINISTTDKAWSYPTFAEIKKCCVKVDRNKFTSSFVVIFSVLFVI